jgi:hypothetical protein
MLPRAAAASFYALSLLGTADPRDKTLQRQRQAADIVAGVRARVPERPVAGPVSLHYLHALDYFAYAHLQLGQDEKAQEVLRAIEAIDQPMQVGNAGGYPGQGSSRMACAC